MPYKVMTTAKRTGRGSVSRDAVYDDLPTVDDLRAELKRAMDEYDALHGADGPRPIVDVTVRKLNNNV